MKTIKSIQNLSVSELLSELYELESDSYIAYIDLYNHFRANTNNFDPIYVALLIRDMIEYVPKIEICWDGDIVTLHDLYFNKTLLKKYDLNPNDFIYGIGLFDLYRELQECCLEIDSSDDYENGNEQLSYVQFGSHYIEQYARMVDEKAQELNIMYEGVSLDKLTGKYYYRGEEVSFDVEKKEIIQPHLKRPQNTHNQQYSILERTGVIGYLKNKYEGITDVALAKLIANILNRDPQNTRVKLSLTGTKNQVSNEMKNNNFIKKMFAQIGL